MGRAHLTTGRAEAYELVADADRTGTAPGQALHDLLQLYAPAVILIDEWVAYALQLHGRDDLAGGTFDTQYLQYSWKAVIDGPSLEPARLDQEKPLFGARATATL